MPENKVKQGPTTKARKVGAITNTALQSAPMAPPASPPFPYCTLASLPGSQLRPHHPLPGCSPSYYDSSFCCTHPSSDLPLEVSSSLFTDNIPRYSLSRCNLWGVILQYTCRQVKQW